MDLGLEVGVRNGTTVVTVRGDLDLATAPRLRDAAVGRLMDGDRRLVIDLDGVEFLDSTGLGTLVAILKRARTLGADLALVVTRERIRKVFELTALTSAFELHEDIEAATAS